MPTEFCDHRISIFKKERDIFKKYFPNRLVDICDNSFEAALDASKHLDAKDLVSAFLSAYYARRHYDPARYPESIIPKILSRVIQSASSLNGAQFKQFSLLLDSWQQTASTAPPRKAEVGNKYAQPHQKGKALVPNKKSNIKAVASNLAVSNKTGQDGAQAISNAQSEAIVVIKIGRKKDGTILECKRKNGEVVLVNPKQVLKARLDYNTVNAGDILKAVIVTVNEKLYANEVHLVAKAEDSKENNANKAFPLIGTETQVKSPSVDTGGNQTLSQGDKSESMINTSGNKAPSKAQVRKLFLGNLHYKAREDDLRDCFNNYGEIVSIKLIKDVITGRLKGFGFIEIGTSEDIDALISKINGISFMERPLNVNKAIER